MESVFTSLTSASCCCAARQPSRQTPPGHTCTTGHKQLQVYLEGPYGAPSIDLYSGRYKCFLIVTSGAGWTFLRAWKRQLCHERSRGRPMRVLMSVAVMRAPDAHHLREFAGWRGLLPRKALLQEGPLEPDCYAMVRAHGPSMKQVAGLLGKRVCPRACLLLSGVQHLRCCRASCL